MSKKIHMLAISFGFLASTAMAQNGQAPQTDYQRIMNSVNNSSSAAYGQPQPDDDAASSTGTAASPNSATPPVAGNMQNQAGSANLPTDGIANSYSANGAPGGFGTAGNNRTGFGNMNTGIGAASTTSGSVGIGAYNASPYNSAPNSNGRGANFTGQ